MVLLFETFWMLWDQMAQVLLATPVTLWGSWRFFLGWCASCSVVIERLATMSNWFQCLVLLLGAWLESQMYILTRHQMQRCSQFKPMRSACPEHTPKKLSGHCIYFVVMQPTGYAQQSFPRWSPPASSRSAYKINIVMKSQILKSLFSAYWKFYKYQTSMDPNFEVERVIIALDYSFWGPINSFTKVSLILAPLCHFLLQYRKWPSGQIVSKAEQQPPRPC